MRILFLLLTLATLAWSGIGNVGSLKGSATVKRSNATLELKIGMDLQIKDVITTLDNSRVQVILNDDTVVTIGKNSTFVFDAYTFGGKKDSEVKMHIERGFFRSVTGKIGKLAPERFKVKTASATIGIRGTDFSALVDDQKETITCYKGQITVLMSNQMFAVDAGMIMDLAQGKATLKKMHKSVTKLQTGSKTVSTNAVSDMTQQEEQSDIDRRLDMPNVGFQDPNNLGN